MTPELLKAWRERLYGTGYGTRSKQTATQALGLSLRTYESYEAGKHRTGNLITTSIETMLAAAAAGVGLVLTGPFLVADLLASGALVPLLPDYLVQGIEINAFYPHRRHLSSKVRVFIDMLVDWFAEQERTFEPDAGTLAS
jgi:DNA-binding transcriptional LysR family regulator